MISKYNLLAVPVVDEGGHILGIVTVDDVIDALVREQTEDVQKFGGMEALDEPYTQISFGSMIKKRAGWLCALFLSEMLTATAMQHFEGEISKAVVLAMFIPLVMSSGGNSGSQATSLIIRALALREIKLGDWWRIALRELPTGLDARRDPRRDRLHAHRVVAEARICSTTAAPLLVALTVGLALVGIVGVRIARGIDAAVPAEATRLRPGECVGAVRRDARRRDGADHLLQRRVHHAEGDVALTGPSS